MVYEGGSNKAGAQKTRSGFTAKCVPSSLFNQSKEAKDRKKEARLSTDDIVMRETDNALSQHWPRIVWAILLFLKERISALHANQHADLRVPEWCSLSQHTGHVRLPDFQTITGHIFCLSGHHPDFFVRFYPISCRGFADIPGP